MVESEFLSYPVLQDRIPKGQLVYINDNVLAISGNVAELEPYVPKNMLVVITGAPGAGKDTLVDAMLAKYPDKFGKPRTVTTRARRSSETTYDPYIRKNEDEFNEMRSRDEFIEVNCHDGNWYGCPKSEVQRVIDEGKVPVIRVDPNGASFFRGLGQNKQHIFSNYHVITTHIIAPNGHEYYQRLLTRTLGDNNGDHKDSRKRVVSRMSTVLDDLSKVGDAHYVIVNGKSQQQEAVNNFVDLLNKFAVPKPTPWLTGDLQ